MRLKSSIHPEHFGLKPGAAPLRRPRHNPVSFGGYVGSHKTEGRLSPFESLLERDLQTLLNADPDIVEYAAQPHCLVYWTEEPCGSAQKRDYIPDAAAITTQGEIIIVDAKAKVFARSACWKHREPHIRKAYKRDHGAHFVVLTEDEIRAQPRFNNCQIMLRHRPPGDDQEGEFVVRACVSGRPAGRLGAVIEAAGERGIDESRAFSALMRMALLGEIALDHSQPLSPSATYSVP